ncbi:M23 family metallopeptidase [Thermosulfurimonas marina]|uniref:M23 family metallopeptidase n=1 Tax=Thermosulfurimonas marina TaxID=2047767 RepID=A0A6H1WQP8_9BACT|nr:M23 family metallopeptidase [Thermosulfurimonas marina]QJA05545.1 M23 family metallopeptidase [Thermosulfurimonas marina]
MPPEWKKLLLLLSLLLGLSPGARAQTLRAHPGEALILSAENFQRARFLGRTYFPVEIGDLRLFLLPIPLKLTPGGYPLTLVRGPVVLRREVSVLPKAYPEERLKLPERMVIFPPKVLARIKKEVALILRTVSRTEGACRWPGPMVPPVKGRVSSPFGLRRILNGRPRSPHSGVDFAVPAGTPVRAAQSGRVVLTGDFYLPGKVIILSHGCGIYTYYAHLSRIKVKKGQEVSQGEVIALSGATGRATGAHLHFGLYVAGERVDPLFVIRSLEDYYERFRGEIATARGHRPPTGRPGGASGRGPGTL